MGDELGRHFDRSSAGGGNHARDSRAAGARHVGRAKQGRYVLSRGGPHSFGKHSPKRGGRNDDRSNREHADRRVSMIVRRRRLSLSSAAKTPAPQRRGVILLAVLVVVAILTLIGYRFFNLMNAEHEAAYATNRVTQSRYLADS